MSKSALDRRSALDEGLVYAEERFWTSATIITILRTVASLGCALWAGVQGELGWLIVALAIYWVGDIADGAVARWRGCETRIGAVVDIVSDRLNCAGFYLGLAWLDPWMAIPAALYLFEFMVVDMVLSLAFLAWPLRSPNFFFRVDPQLWAWNWSPPAKAVNSGLLAVGLLLTGWWAAGAVWAAGLLAFKAWSLRALLKRGLPVPSPDLLPDLLPGRPRASVDAALGHSSVEVGVGKP